MRRLCNQEVQAPLYRGVAELERDQSRGAIEESAGTSAGRLSWCTGPDAEHRDRRDCRASLRPMIWMRECDLRLRITLVLHCMVSPSDKGCGNLTSAIPRVLDAL